MPIWRRRARDAANTLFIYRMNLRVDERRRGDAQPLFNNVHQMKLELVIIGELVEI